MKRQILFLFLVGIAQTVHALEISIEELKQNHYRLTLTHDVMMDISEAQAALRVQAELSCAPLNAVFDKYRFKGSEAIAESSGNETNFIFIQEIICTSESVALPAPTKRFINTSSAAQAIHEKIMKDSESYLTNIAHGRLELAYASLTEGMRSLAGKDEWIASKRDFRSAVGEPITITITRITLYDNPQGAPQPGIYVAADYVNEYQHAPIHCGYLMWYQGEDGEFGIIREEAGTLTAEQVVQIPKDKMPLVKQKLGCVLPQ